MDESHDIVITTNGHADNEEIQKILLGYEECKRRDTTVEREKLHWKLGALLGWVSAVLAILVALWLFLSRTNVQAFVQVVQVDEAGIARPLGIPVDLLSYTPQDGAYLDMIGEWIRKMRWRTGDGTLAQEEWKWVYLHTCGDARKYLQHIEKIEKPFEPTKRRVAVQLKSITKNPAPLSYQAYWEEVITEESALPKVERWTGTVVTGRQRPKDMAMALHNRLGLCLVAFDFSLQPEAK